MIYKTNFDIGQQNDPNVAQKVGSTTQSIGAVGGLVGGILSLIAPPVGAAVAAGSAIASALGSGIKAAGDAANGDSGGALGNVVKGAGQMGQGITELQKQAKMASPVLPSYQPPPLDVAAAGLPQTPPPTIGLPPTMPSNATPGLPPSAASGG
jgi:hypothetical protein